MAHVFETLKGEKYVLPDDPVVISVPGSRDVAIVYPYTEPVERAAVAPPASVPDATGESDSPSSLDTYYEHNGADPHLDSAMQCQCAVCAAVRFAWLRLAL
jgi:hypothetical protein